MQQNHPNTAIHLALTQSQRLIWTGQALNPDAPLYQMALAFELAGEIDIATFQQAFQKLIDTSDSLRSIFVVEDDEPKQIIQPNFPYQLETIDWAENTPSEEVLLDWLSERTQQNTDVCKGTFDSVLIKLASDRFIWFFNQHHLATDGWSVSILYKKMASLYQAALEGTLEETTALPSFVNYQKYEAKIRQTGESPSNLYWQKQQQKLSSTPTLYGYDNPNLGSQSERIYVDLGKERSEQLRQLAQNPDLKAWTIDMSLFNIFATTLFAWMYRVGNQHKIALGTPAHNRLTPQFKNTSGLFIELFPLIVEIDEQEAFDTLFQKVREEANNFLKHAKPGIASTELSRGFNVVLNYINASFSAFAGIDMKSRWVHPNHADPAHLLRLQVHDFDATGNIHLHFDLNADTFPSHIREQVPSHFLTLLDAFIKNRSSLISLPSLALPSPVSTSAPVALSTLLPLMERIAEQYAQKIAISSAKKTLSFEEAHQQANQLANYLVEQGLSKGDRVGLYLQRSPALAIAILAIMKAGGVYVPIDASFTKARTVAMLEDAGAKYVISDQGAFGEDTAAQLLELPTIQKHLASQSDKVPNIAITAEDLAYLMYTSGSTGKPKGVMISHGSLAHYITYARQAYAVSDKDFIPFFTSVSFDLTVTSLMLPWCTGATLGIYPAPSDGADLAVFDVIRDNQATFIKLTPSHLALLEEEELTASKLQTMILGGEDLKVILAQDIQERIGNQLAIFNEYGPTEATVGCIVHRFSADDAEAGSVPIGSAIDHIDAYVLDQHLHQVPAGVVGELYLSGAGLAQGYWQQEELTKENFLPNPFETGKQFYRTGDLVRLNEQGDLVFLGRRDEQVKIGGRRIELGEIENVLFQHEAVETCVVELESKVIASRSKNIINCKNCGLPSNYPNVSFNDEQVCSLCVAYEGYKERVKAYFKSLGDLESIIKSKSSPERDYDCIALLSGGKDSTYTLAKLVEMGLRVLTFTLDNGYISEQAKENVRKITNELGVDHMFGSTPAMNEIFIDSLKTHCNVCDGCFKTIYTLSTQVALEKNIPFIVTGLSRGQFFETRLTEELFQSEKIDIDQMVLNARKAYHRIDDAVKRLLDVSAFEDDAVFEQVQFLDFYRYTDVSLDEMLAYLDQRLSWKRPTDTGRSTNCLINQAGIYTHKKERGYSNYAFPYSWDVRLGHKTRDASLEEINEEIDEQEVDRILTEIGYKEAIAAEAKQERIIAYYTGDEEADLNDIRAYLETILPTYMLPAQYIQLEKIPLNSNGKVAKEELPVPDSIRPMLEVGYVAPRYDIEIALAEIWSEVLNIEQIGVFDKFLDLGGNSLAAIRLITRVNEAFELELPLNLAFTKPTIASFAEFVRETIMELLEQMGE